MERGTAEPWNEERRSHGTNGTAEPWNEETRRSYGSRKSAPISKAISEEKLKLKLALKLALRSCQCKFK